MKEPKPGETLKDAVSALRQRIAADQAAAAGDLKRSQQMLSWLQNEIEGFQECRGTVHVTNEDGILMLFRRTQPTADAFVKIEYANGNFEIRTAKTGPCNVVDNKAEALALLADILVTNHAIPAQEPR